MSNLTDTPSFQNQSGGGTRKLPAFSTHAVVDTPAQDTAQQRLKMLRETFSEELEILRQEARQEGLAIARDKASAELAEVRARTNAEHDRQLQAKLLELQKTATQQAESLGSLISSVQEKTLELAATMEPVIGHLTVAVVAKLLGKQLVDGELLFAMAAQAVKEYRLSEPLRVKVAAADYALLEAKHATEPFFAVFGIDHELNPGDCLIDYGQGQLNAGFETQLAAVRALLTNPPKDRDHVGGA